MRGWQVQGQSGFRELPGVLGAWPEAYRAKCMVIKPPAAATVQCAKRLTPGGSRGCSSTRLCTRRFAEAPGQLAKTDTTSMQWSPLPTAPPSWICTPCRLAARSWISLPTYLSCANGNARPRCCSGSQPWGCGIRCHGRRGSAALAWGALPGRPARWRPVKLATATPVDLALMSRERRETRDRDPMDYRYTEGRGLPSIDGVSSS